MLVYGLLNTEVGQTMQVATAQGRTGYDRASNLDPLNLPVLTRDQEMDRYGGKRGSVNIGDDRVSVNGPRHRLGWDAGSHHSFDLIEPPYPRLFTSRQSAGCSQIERSPRDAPTDLSQVAAGPNEHAPVLC